MSMVFASFEELARHQGISPTEPKARKPKTCRKCGAVLREIPGTNVMVCDGKDKDGKPCGNRVMKSVEIVA